MREMRRTASVMVWALAVLILLAGIWVRLYDLDDPPLDFHPTRQLHNALIARGMYYENRTDVPGWQRDLAVQQWQAEGQIEPPLFERLAAYLYPFIDGPDLVLPRLLAILFWIMGAYFLADLARRWTGAWGMVTALSVYCLAPYAVIASRAFQPDPPMITLVLATLWALEHWLCAAPGRAWRWAIIAGVLAGLAIYVKAVAVFFVGPAILTAFWQRDRLTALRDPQVWTVSILAALPYAAYMIDGLWLRGFLVGQLSERFFPAMWLDAAFYLRWISVMERLFPFAVVVIGAAGALWMTTARARYTLLALWGGYVLYGLALPHHISTHDYYHLPLLILIPLGLSALVETIMRRFPSSGRLAHAALITAVLGLILVQTYQVRTMLKRVDSRPQAADLQQLGQALGPSAPLVALVEDYGSALKYYAWQMPAIWPTADDMRWEAEQGNTQSFTERFEAVKNQRQYFVVSPPELLARQPELAAALAQYPILRQSGTLILYDLRSAP